MRPTLRSATAEEQAQLETLHTRRAEIEAQMEEAGENEEQYAEMSEQIEGVEAQLDALDEQRQVIDPAQRACAGAVVYIENDGKVGIERNLLKPEDARRFTRTGNNSAAEGKARRTHSAALVRRLTAQRTLALQAVLARRADIALIALTHRLVLRTLSPYASESQSTLKIDPSAAPLAPYAKELAGSKAHIALQERREALDAALPKESRQLFAWLLEQPQSDVLGILAFCVAQTVDGVSDSEARGPADELARAAGLDMREWWTATAADYFGSVPKARVLEVIREGVSPEAAASLAKLKKGALVQAAEIKVASTGWLPELLRHNV